MNTKEAFHNWVDSIDNESDLQAYFQWVKMMRDRMEGEVYQSLTEEQRMELDMSYEESFDAKNLISHNQLKENYSKWLEK